MRYFKSTILAITICLLQSFGLSYAQTLVKGQIVNSESGESLPNANITVNNLAGVSSDENGKYQIELEQNKSYTIKISYLGFVSYEKQLSVKNQKQILLNISLMPSSLFTKEVVISATRTENLIKNIPVRINSITQNQIKLNPATSVDEILNHMPGINVSRTFGIFSAKSTVSMRGSTGQEQSRTLVLLDGIPINKTDGGSVNWNLLNAETIQKIEVIKGPGSSLYGGNAMGGIISITTQKPVSPISGKISLEYGSYNTRGTRFSLGGRHNIINDSINFYFSLSGLFRKSDGYITQAPIDINAYTVKSNMQEYGSNLKMGIDVKKNQNIELNINYYNDLRGAGEKVFQEFGSNSEHDAFQYQLSYKLNTKNGKLVASTYNNLEQYKKVSEYIKDRLYSYYDVTSERNDRGFISYYSHNGIKHQNLTFGVDVKQGSVDAADIYYTSTDKIINKGKMNFYAAFAQDEISLFKERVKIIAGFRFDKANFFDGIFTIENPSAALSYLSLYDVNNLPDANWEAISPKISAQYSFGKTGRFYLSYAKGFRPSILDDMCRSGKIKGGFKVANPGLKPEWITNYEAGFDLFFFDKLLVGVSSYYSTGKDYMYYVSTGDYIDFFNPPQPVYVRKNISGVEIYGSEVEFDFKLNKNIDLFANYTYTHATITKYTVNNPFIEFDLTGKFLTNVPEHSAGAGFNWKNKILNFSVLYKYTGEMWINDSNGYDDKYLLSYTYNAFQLFDLKLSKKIKNGFFANIKVQNLLDVKYYDSKGAVNPGRFILGELGFAF